MLSDDQLAPIVQDFYAYVLDQENQLRLRPGAIPEEVRLLRAEFFKKLATQTRTDLACNEFDSVYLIALAMMRKHNLEIRSTWMKKISSGRRSYAAVSTSQRPSAARYEGDFNYEPRDRLLKQKVEALFAAASRS